MNNTLILVLATIVLLFLVLAIIFFLRQRAEISLENNILIVKQPFTTQRIDLDKELESWKIQQAYYLRWGRIYAINMLFNNGKRVAVSSLFNKENYDLLYHLLNSSFKSKRVTERS